MQNSLEQWIECSLRAPSGDNCQPWLFKFSDSNFEISINETAAHHFLDQNFAAAWISIGALCENLTQSSESFGFKCRFEIVSNSSVKVHYSRVETKENKTILETIRNRHTYREILSKVHLDLTTYKLSSSNSDKLFEWQQCGEFSDNLINDWSEMESALWLRTSLMRDFTKWVRLQTKNISDGVTLKNLMLNIPDTISIVQLKLFPFLVKLIPHWIFALTTKIRLKRLLKGSSVVYLTGKFSTCEDFFFAGKEIQAMWLYLTKNQIKAQPLAIQSLFFNYLENPITKSYFTEADLKYFATIKKKTFEALEVKTNLIFMLRIGASNNTIPLLPRKKLVELTVK